LTRFQGIFDPLAALDLLPIWSCRVGQGMFSCSLTSFVSSWFHSECFCDVAAAAVVLNIEVYEESYVNQLRLRPQTKEKNSVLTVHPWKDMTVAAQQFHWTAIIQTSSLVPRDLLHDYSSTARRMVLSKSLSDFGLVEVALQDSPALRIDILRLVYALWNSFCLIHKMQESHFTVSH
jgi:hypothetical protein